MSRVLWDSVTVTQPFGGSLIILSTAREGHVKRALPSTSCVRGRHGDSQRRPSRSTELAVRSGGSGWSTRRRSLASARRPQLGQRPRRRSSRPRRTAHLRGSHLLLARGSRRESQQCLGQGSSVDHRQRSPSLPFEQQRRLRTWPRSQICSRTLPPSDAKSRIISGSSR